MGLRLAAGPAARCGSAPGLSPSLSPGPEMELWPAALAGTGPGAEPHQGWGLGQAQGWELEARLGEGPEQNWGRRRAGWCSFPAVPPPMFLRAPLGGAPHTLGPLL